MGVRAGRNETDHENTADEGKEHTARVPFHIHLPMVGHRGQRFVCGIRPDTMPFCSDPVSMAIIDEVIIIA